VKHKTIEKGDFNFNLFLQIFYFHFMREVPVECMCVDKKEALPFCVLNVLLCTEERSSAYLYGIILLLK
jgi:hypothetical protein